MHIFKKIIFLIFITSVPVLYAQDTGIQEAEIIPLGISPDGRYIAYLEGFRLPGDDAEGCIRSFGFYLIDVPANAYAVTPLFVEEKSDARLFPGTELYSFREQRLRRTLVNQASTHLDRHRIQPGVWPGRVSGTGVDSHRRYYELVWHEGGGHGLEVLATGIPVPDDPNRKMLDLRVRLSRCSLQQEIILQKDSRLPVWRRVCTDYSLMDTYFYRASDKIYTVCFLALTMSGEQSYQRIMCVTGDVTDLWQAALSYQPDFSEGGY